MASKRIRISVKQAAYVRSLQGDVRHAQAVLDAACRALIIGRAPESAVVVGGDADGALIVEYPDAPSD
jgi:hypothetical protein